MKTIFMKTLFMALLAGAAGWLLPANAEISGMQKTYDFSPSRIVALSKNKCVDVPQGTTKEGTVLILWDCHNGSNQFFRAKDINLAHTRIAVYSGESERCLGVTPSAADLYRVQIESCSNPGVAYWRIESDGVLRTTFREGGEACASSGLGQFIVTACRGDWSELQFGTNWSLPAEMGGFGTIVNQHRKCLDVSGASKKPGAKVISYSCHGSDNQRFQLHGTPDRALISVYQQGERLCVSSAGTAAVQALPCNAFDRRQVWRTQDYFVRGVPLGIFSLVNNATGRCLDSASLSACGSGIAQWVLP